MVQGLDRLEPIERETTPGVISGRIRARILDGTFAGGTQLGEARLAARLNVSRGPVREALQRLVQEGLLRNERNRGVFVVSLDEQDIIDVYRARMAIERAAALSLVRSGDQEVLDALEALVERMSEAAGEDDWDSCADLDLQFHETLVRSSNSKRLQRMFSTLIAETRMCLAALEPAYASCKDLVAEHRTLLEAMRRGDEREVPGLVERHLEDAVGDPTGTRSSPI